MEGCEAIQLQLCQLPQLAEFGNIQWLQGADAVEMDAQAGQACQPAWICNRSDAMTYAARFLVALQNNAAAVH